MRRSGYRPVAADLHRSVEPTVQFTGPSNIFGRHIVGVNKNYRDIGKLAATMKLKNLVVDSGDSFYSTVLTECTFEEPVLFVSVARNRFHAGSAYQLAECAKCGRRSM